VLLFAKILLVVGVVGLLRSFPQFRSMSRALDEDALRVLRRAVRGAEDNGYPPELIPLLMLLAAWTWVVMTQFTTPFAH
jgi:hypothetical protein